MGRSAILAGGALMALLPLASALAETLAVNDGNGSYRYPTDCAAAFENHAAIESHMRARGRDEELNAFNHRCSIYLSGNRIDQAGTGIRALGSDMFNELWRNSGASGLVNRLKR